MEKIHISTARLMFAKKEPVDITVVTRHGELQTLKSAIPLQANFYAGSRNFKLPNGQIRKIRDNLIMAVNGIEVYI